MRQLVVCMAILTLATGCVYGSDSITDQMTRAPEMLPTYSSEDWRSFTSEASSKSGIQSNIGVAVESGSRDIREKARYVFPDSCGVERGQVLLHFNNSIIPDRDQISDMQLIVTHVGTLRVLRKVKVEAQLPDEKGHIVRYPLNTRRFRAWQMSEVYPLVRQMGHHARLTFALRARPTGIDNYNRITGFSSARYIADYLCRGSPHDHPILRIRYKQNKSERRSENIERRRKRNLKSKDESFTWETPPSDSHNASCMLHPLVIDFDEIEGYDPLYSFIRVPRRLDVGFCAGTCESRARVTESTFRSQVILQMRRESKLPAASDGLASYRLCKPAYYKPLTILWQDSEGSLHKTTIPDMIVDSCVCSGLD